MYSKRYVGDVRTPSGHTTQIMCAHGCQLARASFRGSMRCKRSISTTCNQLVSMTCQHEMQVVSMTCKLST